MKASDKRVQTPSSVAVILLRLLFRKMVSTKKGFQFFFYLTEHWDTYSLVTGDDQSMCVCVRAILNRFLEVRWAHHEGFLDTRVEGLPDFWQTFLGFHSDSGWVLHWEVGSASHV